MPRFTFLGIGPRKVTRMEVVRDPSLLEHLSASLMLGRLRRGARSRARWYPEIIALVVLKAGSSSRSSSLHSFLRYRREDLFFG